MSGPERFPLVAGVIYELLSEQRLFEFREVLNGLSNEDVDKLAIEFGDLFMIASNQHDLFGVSLPQSQINIGEAYIETVYFIIANLSASIDEKAQTILSLLIKTMATPTNVKYLLRIMDANFRVGAVRCNAILIMSQVVNYTDINFWSMKLDVDADDGSRRTLRFATEYMNVLGKVLHDEVTRRGGDRTITHVYCDMQVDKRIKCKCIERVWTNLLTAMQMTKDDPFIVVDILDRYDWTAILEPDEAPITTDSGDTEEKYFFDMSYVDLLVKHAKNALLIDKDNAKGRNLLRKVGRCRSLFHRVLKRVITMEYYSQPPEIADPILLLEDLLILSNYFHYNVMYALDSPSTDDETKNLVDCAQTCLQRVMWMPKVRAGDPKRPYLLKNHIAIVIFDLTSSRIVEWAARTEDERIDMMLKECRNNTKLKRQHDSCRNAYKELVSDAEESGELKRYNMCANCFVTDIELKKEGKSLLKCSICKQVTYCSKKCQKKHWKKHKKVCRK